MTGFSFTRKPRTAREQALLAASERTMACGIRGPSLRAENQMVVERAQGSHLFDCSGNEYIDYLLGSGPMFIGHAHPAVVAAVARQLEAGSSFLLGNEPAIRLCEAIVAAVPCAEKVTLHNSGSEATHYAMRLARAYRRRDVILKFEGGYHGMGDDALMSNQWTFRPAEFPVPVPNSAGIPAGVAGQVLVAPFNDLDRTEQIVRRHADALGGIIVEPLCRTTPPVPGFLPGLQALARELDIPLIFDEVVTGFRLAFGGAQVRYGVVPDLCALGKAISAGHPLGVVAGRADIMDLAGAATAMTPRHVRLTGTYSGNPVSAAAALAVIEELKTPGIYEAVEARGRRLQMALARSLEQAGIAAQVVGEATAFQPWFTAEAVRDHRSTLRADWGRGLRFGDLLLDRGIIKGHEKFFLSTAHTDDDIDYTIDAFEQVAGQL